MIKFTTIDEYNKRDSHIAIPNVIANAILGDLLMFENMLDEAYYNSEYIAKYGPYVVIMNREEFANIETLIPSIEKNSYEYNDIIGITSKGYIHKLLYLFNNGETGIIVYVLPSLENENDRFGNTLYITSKVKNELTNGFIGLLFNMVDIYKSELKDKIDYLQIFKVQNIEDSNDNIIVIEHSQEQPEYHRTYYIPNVKCKDCKLYLISEKNDKEEEYSTLMFAEEY